MLAVISRMLLQVRALARRRVAYLSGRASKMMTSHDEAGVRGLLTGFDSCCFFDSVVCLPKILVHVLSVASHVVLAHTEHEQCSK